MHYSKVKLLKIFPQSSPQCESCKNSAGTLAHQFWQCSKIQPFWCSIFRWYSYVLKVNLVSDPEIALFGISCTLDTMAQKLRIVISCLGASETLVDPRTTFCTTWTLKCTFFSDCTWSLFIITILLFFVQIFWCVCQLLLSLFCYIVFSVFVYLYCVFFNC